MKRLLLATAMATIATSGAMAADLPSTKYAPISPVIVPSMFSFAGFYAGVNAGYAFAKANRTAVGTVGPFGLSTGDKYNTSFIGGAQIGYNYQMGTMLFGIEADIDYISLKLGRQSVSTGFGQGIVSGVSPGLYDGGSKVNWFGTVRPRIGFIAMERLLIYGTGGLAYGNVRTRALFPAGFVKHDKIRVGWTLGAGLEYAVTDQVSVRGEYDYVDLGKGERMENLTFGAPDIRHAARFHVIRAGLNYKF